MAVGYYNLGFNKEVINTISHLSSDFTDHSSIHLKAGIELHRMEIQSAAAIKIKFSRK